MERIINNNNNNSEWLEKLKPRKWLVIILSAILMGINISLAAMSEDIASRFAKNDQTAKDTLRIDIILSASFTQLISTIGIIGAFRENYRQIKYFTLLTAVNTVFSLYISIKAFGLSMLTLLNILILYIAAKYERSLKRKLLNNSRVRFTNGRASETTNSNNNNQISCIASSNSEYALPPPQYEPPPPYSEELTKLPKIV